MLRGELRFDFISPNHVCSHAHASEFMPAPCNVNIFNGCIQYLNNYIALRCLVAEAVGRATILTANLAYGHFVLVWVETVIYIYE